VLWGKWTSGVVGNISILLVQVAAATADPTTEIGQVFAALPATVGVLIGDMTNYQWAIGYAVAVPGVLASLTVLLGGCLGHRQESDGHCCSKLFNALSYLLLFLAFLMYLTLMAISVAVKLPMLQVYLEPVTGVCGTTLPYVNQMVADSNSSLIMAESSGSMPQSQLDDLTTTLNGYASQAATISALCGGIYGMIAGLGDMFLEAALCLAGVLWCYFATFGLCCTEGCLKAPDVQGKTTTEVDPETGKAVGVEMIRA
jgi:hypothetical protein